MSEPLYDPDVDAFKTCQLRLPLKAVYSEFPLLFSLNGKSAVADADLHARCLLSFMIELITENDDSNAERANNQIENAAIHDAMPSVSVARPPNLTATSSTRTQCLLFRGLGKIFLGHQPEVSCRTEIHAASREPLAAIRLQPQICRAKLRHQLQGHSSTPSQSDCIEETLRSGE
jgi:hypothetical protein